LGYDREAQDKPAGLRTYMLVSLGAAVFTQVPIQLGIAADSPGDFARIVQGLITGIGFIGGGVILHQNQDDSYRKVKGVTTAAGIWVAASLGLIAGCGLWRLELVAAGLGWFTLSLLKRVEDRLRKKM
jgi:putative Mg2+ transporter-C (MgtC) family protein